MAVSKALVSVLVLGLIASSSAAGARNLQQNNLLAEAQHILGNAAGTIETGLSGIVHGLFGAANSFFTQIPQNIQHLSWDSLTNLDITNPVEDFVNSIKHKTLAKDILEAEDKITDFIDQFCEPEKFTPSKLIPSNCVGKQLMVRLAPWECELYSNKTIQCSPPYIEIIKTPAECSAKHHKPASFKGKECKLEKKIGQHLIKTIGGDAFSIDISKNLLSVPQQVSSSMLPGLFDAQTAVSGAVQQVTAPIAGLISAATAGR